MNLKGRSFLTLKDFTPEEIGYLLDLAAELKAKKKQGILGTSLKGKNIALIFELVLQCERVTKQLVYKHFKKQHYVA